MYLMKVQQLVLFVFACLISLQANAQMYMITDFGARADSTVLNTKAIQSAIDECFNKGGGEVGIPAGTFRSGTILLKSNVYLRLLPGAVLQGSYNPADYPEHPIAWAQKYGTITHDGLYVETMKALVIADRAHHTGIVGQGTVRGAGDGKAFQLGLNKDGKPKNLFFVGCSDILLRDVQVQNSAQITISISGCDKVNIDGITVQSLANWNCDGMDVDARDVRIANCMIDSEDDALCFKSEYLSRFCENITVTNCVLSSLCNGIKMGTGSRTGFRNISISNCIVKRSSFNGYRHWSMPSDIVYQPELQSVNTGIVILGVDGGLVENINVSDIVMTDVISPIFIRVGRRFLTPDQKTSAMRHITIQNIRAESRSTIPSIIAGLAESPVEDVRIANVRVSVPIAVPAGSLSRIPVLIPESQKGYPENRLTFGTWLPASAFYIRHARGITMTDIAVWQPAIEARSAFYTDDARNVRLTNVTINGNQLKEIKNGLVKKDSESVTIRE